MFACGMYILVIFAAKIPFFLLPVSVQTLTVAINLTHPDNNCVVFQSSKHLVPPHPTRHDIPPIPVLFNIFTLNQSTRCVKAYGFNIYGYADDHQVIIIK